MSQELTSLLERQPDPAYIEEWTALVQKEPPAEKKGERKSVVIFRLGELWFALKTELLSDIASMRTVHRIPHRSSAILSGLVNLRGQLRLCVSLHQLLEVEELPTNRFSYRQWERLATIKRGAELWIFPVDEIFGTYQYVSDQLLPPPASIGKAQFLSGMLQWGERPLRLLDDELLFEALRRSLL